MPAIQLFYGDAHFIQLRKENLAQPGGNVQQSEKSRRIEAAAVSQPSPYDVILVRGDLLQDAQKLNRMIQHCVHTDHQLDCALILLIADHLTRSFQIESSPFKQKF